MIYVGYDPREHIASAVCCSSIRRNGGEAMELKWDFGKAGEVYSRPFHKDHNQYIDDISGAPFSTQFSFSRFLVPHLTGYRGWAAFVDCDIVFNAPVKDLFANCDDKYAVMVVKHNHQPKNFSKMDGVAQTRYRRKNWSSVILWNCAHPSNAEIGPEQVNQMPGLWLHGFDWLDDSEIGELPVEWNYLVGYNTEKECPKPKLIHYTEGGPYFRKYSNVEHADVWWDAFYEYMA